MLPCPSMISQLAWEESPIYIPWEVWEGREEKRCWWWSVFWGWSWMFLFRAKGRGERAAERAGEIAVMLQGSWLLRHKHTLPTLLGLLPKRPPDLPAGHELLWVFLWKPAHGFSYFFPSGWTCPRGYCSHRNCFLCTELPYQLLQEMEKRQEMIKEKQLHSLLLPFAKLCQG